MAEHKVAVTAVLILELEEGSRRTLGEIAAAVRRDLELPGQTLYAVHGSVTSSAYRLTGTTGVTAGDIEKD